MFSIAMRMAGYQQGMWGEEDVEVDEDYPAAVALFRRCIEEEHNVNALYFLANILVDGKPGVPMDAPAAHSLYLQCITQSQNKGALLKLAKLMQEGRPGVLANTPLAVTLYEKLSNAKLMEIRVEAMYGLADIHIEKGTVEGFRTGVGLFQACIDMGRTEQASHLGALLLAHIHKSERDVPRALRILETYCDTLPEIFEIIGLAQETCTNEPHLPEDGPLAIQLLQICMAKSTHPIIRFTMARVLASQTPGVVEDRRRILALCLHYVHLTGNCTRVSLFALEVARGINFMKKDEKLAVGLCLNMLNMPDKNVVLVILGRLLCTIAPESGRDVRRARLLYLYCVEAKIPWNRLKKFAKELTTTKSGSMTDPRLPMKLCELHLAKGYDPCIMVAMAEMLISTKALLEINARVSIELCAKFSKLQPKSKLAVQLATKLAEGTAKVMRHPMYARQILETCMKDDNVDAFLSYVEILVTDIPACTPGHGIAILQCRSFLERNADPSVTSALAKLLEDYDVQEWIHASWLASSLHEMCISFSKDAESMMSLAEMLNVEQHQTEERIERVVSLCKQSLNAGVACDRVLNIVRTMIAESTAPNLAAAREICEMCIAERDDANAKITLAEMVLMEACATDIALDKQLILELCRNVLVTDALCDRVVDLARRIADAVKSVVRSVPLAVQLLEMCVAKNNCRAMYHLSKVLEEGWDDFETDEVRAAQLLQRATVGGVDADAEDFYIKI